MAQITGLGVGARPPRSTGGGSSIVLRRFLQRRLAVVSVAVLALLVVGCIAGPYFWTYSHEDITPTVLAAPSWAHPFGTDAVGHDMLAQVMRGTQRSLAVAAIVAILSTTLGTLIGMTAGYAGGRVESILMRGVDLVLMLPLLAILGLVAVRLGGNENGWLIVAVAISLLFWTPTAMVIRTTVVGLKQSDFVESARIVGASTPRVLGRHLLPHLVGPIAVVTTTYVAAAIGLEATLSFLGLGVQPPDTSLGLLLKQGVGFASTMWWLFYLPSFVILLIVLLVHFIGDGLQAAFNRDGQSH